MFGCIVAGRWVQTNLQQVAPSKYLFVLDNPSRINHIVLFLTGQSLFESGLGASIYLNCQKGHNGMMASEDAGCAAATWHFLGILTNEKPSAIFRVGNLTGKQQQGGSADWRMDEDQSAASSAPIYPSAMMLPEEATSTDPSSHSIAQIGISIEPLALLAELAQTSAPAITSLSSATIAAGGSSSALFLAPKHPTRMLSTSSFGGAAAAAVSPGDALSPETVITIGQKLVENLLSYILSFAGSASGHAATNLSSAYMVPVKIIQDWYGSLTRKISADPEGFLRSLTSKSS